MITKLNPVYDLSSLDECARLVLDSRGHKGRQQAHMALIVRKGQHTQDQVVERMREIKKQEQEQ